MATRPTRVCCCLSLRTACLFISISCIGLYLWQIIQYNDVMEVSGVRGPYSKTGISYTGAVLGAIVNCSFIIANVMLLIGILLYRRQLFLPWIGVAVAMIIKEIIYVMFFMYTWIDGSKYENLVMSVVLSILNGFTLVSYIAIVRRYYEELKEDERIGGLPPLSIVSPRSQLSSSSSQGQKHPHVIYMPSAASYHPAPTE